MQFDEVLKHLGECGNYQRLMYVLLCLPCVLVGFQKLNYVFLAVTPPYRCQIPILEDDKSNLGWNHSVLEQFIPWDSEKEEFEGCSRFAHNEWNDSELQRDEVGCPDGPFVWDTSEFHSSVVIEWNLVCSKRKLQSLSSSIFFVGVLLGSIIFGDLSDRIGRKKTYMAAILVMSASGVAAAFAPEFWSFTILRAIAGGCSTGIFIVAFVIGTELVGPSRRTLAGISIQFFWAAGYVLVAGVHYLIPDWKYFQLALSLPGFLLPVYWWILPESVRWLLTQKKFNQAETIIKRASKVNGVTIPEHLLKSHELQEKKSCSTENLPATSTEKLNVTDGPGDKTSVNGLDLFRYPNLRKKTLNIFFCWFVCSMVYYGLSLSSGDLGGNLYVNHSISGAVEFPAYAVCLLGLAYAGRRWSLCTFLIVGGLACVSTYFVPAGLHWLTLTMAMTGKFCITAAYAAIYMFSAEQFPTVVRNTGVGWSSMCARIGGILAPQIGDLGNIHKAIPLVTFGVLACIAGALILLLPETRGVTLPETIQDGEALGRAKGASSSEEQEGTQCCCLLSNSNKHNDNGS